ncbi:hypothetical protein [Nocardia arthritidis]|uniref:Uncharacterized protein n=1 Tax=Nocardia arthritidis TaxID=228602 RepID=A0A6G9YLR5_9NOCA|nr:hypothetical protein [Nocardia arthritidis]QIS14219.1 hypothetical protein F5544_31900 [Nocardia arthritidis]
MRKKLAPNGFCDERFTGVREAFEASLNHSEGEQSDGHDPILGGPVRFGMGYELASAQTPLPNRITAVSDHRPTARNRPPEPRSDHGEAGFREGIDA